MADWDLVAAPTAAVRIPEDARCSVHPDRAARSACHRCGAFVCADDLRRVDGVGYCATCAARPDVDYLEAFRLRYWGKRDAWAWFVGIGTLLTAGLLFPVLGDHQWLNAAVLALLVAAGVCFFLGQRWARYAGFGIPLLTMVLARHPGGLALGVLPLLFVVAMFFDRRSQLFFKVPQSRGALRQTWHVLANNVHARVGFQSSLVALFVPGLCAISLALSISGLLRVDPAGRPPVGRKGQAIAGVVISSLDLCFWLGVLALRFAVHREA